MCYCVLFRIDGGNGADYGDYNSGFYILLTVHHVMILGK